MQTKQISSFTLLQDIKKLQLVYNRVNENIIKEMAEKYGCWTVNYIKECLKQNVMNYCTSSYYLI